jgi:pimeloyl-ACP methyl ester carboxylesterase
MPYATTISPSTQAQIDAANASGKPPVVFIHGLWLLANSWDRWAGVFTDAGFAPVKAAWPDDPETVEEARLIRRYSLVSPSGWWPITCPR